MHKIQTIFFWFRNPWKKKEFITPRYEIKKWMSTSRSMFVIAATQLLYSTADIIILRLVIGEKIAGIYHVAVTLSILVTIPAKAILTIVARHIARLSSDKEQALKERLIQISLRLLILPTLFLSVCLILFGKKILLLFGSGYVVAYDIMVLLVFAQFISSFETFNGAVLNYSGSASEMAKIRGIVTPLGIIASLIGAFLIGPIAVAIIFLLFRVVVTTLVTIRAKQVYDINLFALLFARSKKSTKE